MSTLCCLQITPIQVNLQLSEPVSQVGRRASQSIFLAPISLGVLYYNGSYYAVTTTGDDANAYPILVSQTFT